MMMTSVQSNAPQSVQQQRSSYPRAAATRSTQPEIFTFERIPTRASAVRSYVPLRPRRRCTRVMYPPTVRMHLPPAERSPAKRWLLVLILVVLWQVYTEEPGADSPDSPAVLPLQAAEEPACLQSCPWSRVLSNTSVPGLETGPVPGLETGPARAYDQSTSNGYMVALLVYHKLGCDPV